MRVTNLHLKNFGSHVDTKHEFVDRGIIGIVGPNGCGKSTLLSAMLFALTGDSGNDGKKEDDFNWAAATAEGKQPGFVELGFAHAGDTFLVKRNIRTATSSVKIGDAKAITGASKVTAQIAKSLGVTPAILQDIVFVRQGKLEGALFERPSDRKRAFQQLFGTHRAEVIREALGKELGNLSDEDLTAI
jgi:exonuclease SbcC